MKCTSLTLALSVAAYSAHATAVSGDWKCLPGYKFPVRLTVAGLPECMAPNGLDCLRPATDDATATCLSFKQSPPPNVQPLTCGPQHFASTWKISGYESTDHWCVDSHAQLYAIESAPTPWECLPGYKFPVRLTSGGLSECMAPNGLDCLRPATDDTAATCLGFKTSPPTDVKPLTCGPKHFASTWNITGFESTGHWCTESQGLLYQLRHQ